MTDHLLRYVYLYLDALTLLGPLLLSFDRRVAFYRTWRWLLPSIAGAAAIYLTWDVLFTQWGVWRFNYAHLVGPSWLGLPLEEWLFFAVVPYATVFIYECRRCYELPRLSARAARVVTYVLLVGLVALAAVYGGRLYTSWTALATALALALHLRLLGVEHLRTAYVGWLVCLIPFFAVNGVLTALPVVIYTDAENLGIRLGSIPVEDAFYGFTLYLLTLTGLEWGRRRGVSQPLSEGD